MTPFARRLGAALMTILNFLMREFNNNKRVTPRVMLHTLEEFYKGLWKAPKTWMTVDDHKAWQETMTLTRRIVSLGIGINQQTIRRT